jgi:hypothetical protein
MGGQACIVYGAAEFSRDLDLAVQADERNLERLRRALMELGAEPAFVPPLSRAVLERGHACHFRLQAAPTKGFRIDVMSVLRGCADFESLWARRRRFRSRAWGTVQLLDLSDLVQAKKTQRDKDWPMIQRLVEADYRNRPRRPAGAQVRFWLREARTRDLLFNLCRAYPGAARRLAPSRPAIQAALAGDAAAVDRALRAEEDAIRAADRAYWQPLREELFRWRQEKRDKI